MKVNIKIVNAEKLDELIDRTKKATKELENCIWEIRSLQLDVEVADKNK